MVRVALHEHAAVLEVAGAIDVSDVVALRNEIHRLSGTETRVVVDMTAAYRLGPRWLALLVDEYALLVQHGCELRIVSGRPDAELGRLFRLYPTVDEALA